MLSNTKVDSISRSRYLIKVLSVTLENYMSPNIARNTLPGSSVSLAKSIL